MPGCDNCYYSSPKVGTKGPEDSPFVIVGESPGIMEVIDKKPFVGDSGIVIHKALERAGFCQVEPYWTNAIHCLPQQKNAENLAAACMRCRPRLLEEIRRHPRQVILALGATALQSLTGDFSLKITQERGKLFETPLAEIGIIAAVHPAFLLRGGGNLIQFERDVRYAVKLVNMGSDARLLPDGTTYEVLETPEAVAEFAEELRTDHPYEHVSGDIETTGLHFVKDEILCIGIQHKDHHSKIIPANLITDELFQNNKRWVWHNGKFDVKFLRHNGFPSAWVDEDNMLLNYSLNEKRGIHDLDQVGLDWLGEPGHKHMLKPYLQGKIVDPVTGLKRKKHYGDIPKDVLYRYLALDSNKTYRAFPVMREKVRADPHLEKWYTRTLIPASEYLVNVEMNGMTADQPWMLAQQERLEKVIARCESAFNALAEKSGFDATPINMRSWQQLKPFIYGHLKLGPMSLGTDEDTLKMLKPVKNSFGRDRRHLALQLLMRHRKVAKIYGTYVKNMWEKITDEGKIHPTFKLAATATSRLASEDPNAQNIPRDPRIRGIYVPRPGYAILEVDYSQAELRCLAVLSGCPDLCAIFDQGKDLHNEVSSYLFGPNFTREEKMAAKTLNFGIVYGRTAASIATDPDLAAKITITVQMAQSWIDGWATRFPVAWAFIQKCRNAPLQNLTLTTVFGNKKRPGVVSDERLFEIQNESANFFHQSIASNCNLHAGIKLIKPLKERYDTHIFNTVHDCIVTETPFGKLIDSHGIDFAIRRVHEVAAYMSDVMENEPKLWGQKRVPFKVEPEFGFRWGNVLKFKDIDKLYNGDFSAVPTYIPAH